MKWIVLLAALGVGVPLLARKASVSATVRAWILRILAFELFNPAHVNLVSDELYRGDSRGLEVTTVDLLLLALFFSQPKGSGRNARRVFLVVQIFYAVALALSMIASPDRLRSLYGVWKVGRMLFAFAVLAVEMTELPLILAALQGLAAGVLSQGLLALYQRYGLHLVRVAGSQAHPNSLAMLVNLICPVAFALFLSGAGGRVPALVFAVAGVCDILTLSRGGMIMFLLGAILVSAGSLARGVTLRKIKILAGMSLGGAIVLAYSVGTIVKRFEEAPKESELARELFKSAARGMADEHPFGVGFNMYSQALSTAGYAERFGIGLGDRDGIAHHIYWLTAAETGYFGLFTYVLMLGAVYVVAVRVARRRGLDGDIGLGIVVGLTVTYVQGTAEWIARQTPMGYAFWLYAAMAAALFARRPMRDP